MKTYFYILVFIGIYSTIKAQPNCEAYKYFGDTLQYNACNVALEAKSYSQFSREFQEIYDSSLEICPYFAYAYREKSVAYLKSGDFLTWKELIDKAVKYDELGNLDYRGWCKFQFFRDYKGAILDFERLELITEDIGYSQNGHYHLQIVKGLCYSAIGEKEKAIEIMSIQIAKNNYFIGPYDYYQLGVTYFQVGNYNEAMKAFIKQSEINQLAENLYYIAKIHKINNQKTEYEKTKNQAIAYYKQGQFLMDPYTHHFNKVYLTQIENE